MKRHALPALALLVASAILPVKAVPGAAVDVPPPTMPSNMESTLRPLHKFQMPLQIFNFIKECVEVEAKKDSSQQVLAAWLPIGAFVNLYATQSGITPTEELKAKVDQYKTFTVFIVDNKSTDKYQNQVEEPIESIRARATLTLPDGTTLRPLEALPAGFPDAASKIGNFGAGKRGHMLVFDTGAKELDSETHPKGVLKLTLGPTETQTPTIFSWRLPIELSGNSSACSKCHSDVSSKWSFCPYCGTKIK